MVLLFLFRRTIQIDLSMLRMLEKHAYSYGSLSSTSSPSFIICVFFDDGHSDWCEVITSL